MNLDQIDTELLDTTPEQSGELTQHQGAGENVDSCAQDTDAQSESATPEPNTALESHPEIQEVHTRLQEIVTAVSSPEISLDQALSLYEEAVSLGLKASELLDESIA